MYWSASLYWDSGDYADLQTIAAGFTNAAFQIQTSIILNAI